MKKELIITIVILLAALVVVKIGELAIFPVISMDYTQGGESGIPCFSSYNVKSNSI